MTTTYHYPLRQNDKYKVLCNAVDDAYGVAYKDYYTPQSCKDICLAAYKLHFFLCKERMINTFVSSKRIEKTSLTTAVGEYYTTLHDTLYEQAHALEILSRVAYDMIKKGENVNDANILEQ